MTKLITDKAEIALEYPALCRNRSNGWRRETVLR